MEENNFKHLDDKNLYDDRIKIAVIGSGISTQQAIERIEKEYNQDLVVVYCDSFDEAKELDIKIIIDSDDFLNLKKDSFNPLKDIARFPP